MPRNGSPTSSPSSPRVCAVEGCHEAAPHSAWQDRAESLIQPPFGARSAGSDAGSVAARHAGSCPVLAVGGCRPKDPRFSRYAVTSRAKGECLRNDVAVAAMDWHDLVPSTALAASSPADGLADMVDTLPDAARPSVVGRDQPTIGIKGIEDRPEWHSPEFEGESQAVPRHFGQSPDAVHPGDRPLLIDATANAPERESRRDLLQWATTHTSIRLPSFEGGPRTSTAKYAEWRDELWSFQHVNRLPNDAMACLLIEQRALFGHLVELLLQDLCVDDVIAPTRERVNGVGIQRIYNRLDYVFTQTPKGRFDLVVRQWCHATHRPVYVRLVLGVASNMEPGSSVRHEYENQ